MIKGKPAGKKKGGERTHVFTHFSAGLWQGEKEEGKKKKGWRRVEMNPFLMLFASEANGEGGKKKRSTKRLSKSFRGKERKGLRRFLFFN